MLGGFDVQVNGVAVPVGAWRLSKARSLLKLLALVDGHSGVGTVLSLHAAGGGDC